MKIFRQIKSGYCGPAVIQAVIFHLLNLMIDQEEIAAAVDCTTEKGTVPEALAAFFSNYGLQTFPQKHTPFADLRPQLEEVVIVLFQHDGDGHYGFVLDVDRAKRVMVLGDPEAGRALPSLKQEVFEEAWYDTSPDGRSYRRWSLRVRCG